MRPPMYHTSGHISVLEAELKKKLDDSKKLHLIIGSALAKPEKKNPFRK